ncbi:MAG: heme lyase CcmF/NrfE family subunit [Chloroflexi bacterium]|nr:heme lyase CcmF/NrfE family subunit [Chloroflexota bacterium]
MTELGRVALIVALALSVYVAIASVTAARSGLPKLLVSARRGVIAVAAFVTLASAALLYAILTHDFQVHYVYQYSSREMSVFYLVSSFWAGNEGSLLLWAWLLSVFGLIVLLQTRRENREISPYVVSIIMVVEAFFLMLVVFVTDPFKRSIGIPPDGQGLNPLLENPGMFFHPTTLYLGYVGFTVPFAFATAALITGRLGDQWLRSTRRWTLFAWMFLGLGNLFGGQWAYVELGWGGWWAWDPVENASAMPWLTGTAYLHSVMIQQRRGMLKVWNIVLIDITFALSILGTLLTRSGILSSVHSFGLSNLGPFFVGFLLLILFVSAIRLIQRLPNLRSSNELDSLVSRESAFLFNNLILLGAAFATLWGTLFPLVSEAVRGVKITVGPPFFNQVNGPILLALILLMGICPLIGWRRASTDNLVRNFLYPAMAGIIGSILLYAVGIRQKYALIIFTLCIFVATTILIEVYRGVRSRHRSTGENYLVALPALVWRNKPRYGGYIIHLGIILMAVGVAGSTFYDTEVSGVLSKGDSISIKNYVLTYNGLTSYPTAKRDVVSASLTVKDNKGKYITTLNPAKTFHENHQETPTTSVDIKTGPIEELYTILNGWETDETASFKIIVNPLVQWLWIGGGVMVFGSFIAFLPDARERRRAEVREAMTVGLPVRELVAHET